MYHPGLYRNYCRKNDMDDPPLPDDGSNGSSDKSNREEKHSGSKNYQNLEEKYYRYGIRPEWLQVHRVINHRTLKDGSTLYLVKWRELSYDQSSWEAPDDPGEFEIPDLQKATQDYWDLRASMEAQDAPPTSKKASG